MKYFFLVIALLLVASPVLADHEVAAGQTTYCNKYTPHAGDPIPHCGGGNGPIIPRTSWDVYQARIFVNGVSNEQPVVLKVVKSEKEYVRLSQLEVARVWIERGMAHLWRGTIVQLWIDAYRVGER